jgi:hypothetical protein
MHVIGKLLAIDAGEKGCDLASHFFEAAYEGVAARRIDHGSAVLNAGREELGAHIGREGIVGRADREHRRRSPER